MPSNFYPPILDSVPEFFTGMGLYAYFCVTNSVMVAAVLGVPLLMYYIVSGLALRLKGD